MRGASPRAKATLFSRCFASVVFIKFWAASNRSRFILRSVGSLAISARIRSRRACDSRASLSERRLRLSPPILQPLFLDFFMVWSSLGATTATSADLAGRGPGMQRMEALRMVLRVLALEDGGELDGFPRLTIVGV